MSLALCPQVESQVPQPLMTDNTVGREGYQFCELNYYSFLIFGQKRGGGRGGGRDTSIMLLAVVSLGGPLDLCSDL